MKTIKYKNLIDSKTKKPIEVEVPDDFNEYSDNIAEASLRGRMSGKRFRRWIRNMPDRSTG